jgi:hypothetical protein
MEQGVHLMVRTGANLSPTGVCIVRVSPRGSGTMIITLAMAHDVERGGPEPAGSYADAEDALEQVAEFLRRGGATFRTDSSGGHDE